MSRTFFELSWPLRCIDRMVDTMLPGGIHVIAAGTGVGKTTLLLRGARAWASAGIPGTFLGTEMPRDQLLQRIVAARCNYKLADFKRERWGAIAYGSREAAERMAFEVPEEFAARCAEVQARAAAVEAEVLTELELVHIPDNQSPTVSDLVREMRELAAHGGRWLIVDHLGQVDFGSRGATPDAMTRALVAIKRAAVEMDLVVIIAIQFNRDERNDSLAAFAPPKLSWLKGSSHSEHIAESVIALGPAIREDLSSEELKDRMRKLRLSVGTMRDIRAPNLTKAYCLKHRDLGWADGGGTGWVERLEFFEGDIMDPKDVLDIRTRRAPHNQPGYRVPRNPARPEAA